jgi:hypothetical protein
MLSVHSGVSTVREKPLPATCFDSFAQLYSGLIVNAPDLSSTCIEFEGTLAGRLVSVLLDSGASANFVNSDLVHELSLPTAPISSPVNVRVADGRTSVVKHSVTADLSVGTMHFGVICMPTELYHYDFVLGKPWLTVFNPFINWKLNAVSLVHAGKTHVLLGSQRSGLPEYVVSSMEVEEMVKSGEPVYIVKLNAVNVDSDTNTSDVPGWSSFCRNSLMCCQGYLRGFLPLVLETTTSDWSRALLLLPPASTRCPELSWLSYVHNFRSSWRRVLSAHLFHPTVHPFYLSRRRIVAGVYVLTIELLIR